MNLQGDEPLMNIEDIRNLNNQMIKNQFSIRNFSFKIKDKKYMKIKILLK